MASYLSIIERTDELIKRLQNSFVSYSNAGATPLWVNSPTYRSLYNLCKDNTVFNEQCREHASSPYTNTSPMRRILSSLLVMDASKQNSLQEREDVAHFIETTQNTIKDHSRMGLSNRYVHALFFEASHLNQTHGFPSFSVMPQRDAMLLEALPSVIEGCAETNPESGVLNAFNPLTTCHLPKTISDSLFDVMMTCAHKIMDNEKTAHTSLVDVLLRCQYSSAFLYDDDVRANRMKTIWKKGIDLVDMLDTEGAINLAQEACQPLSPAHPLIKQEARYIVQNYKVPVSPEMGLALPSALQFALGSRSEN